MILSGKQAPYFNQLESVRSRISSACDLAGRQATDVALLAVSKRQPIEAIKGLQALGLNEFGESYASEGVEKLKIISDPELVWHFIGPIQSNKTRLIAEHFDWVQSVDRARIADRLNRQRPENMAPLQVLIQVNIDSEPQKAGVMPNQLDTLAEQVAELPAMNFRGLMAIPRFGKPKNEQRRSFSELKSLFENLKSRYKSVDMLSMGMSDDMDSAILEGSTMVRVGTALFGPRQG